MGPAGAQRSEHRRPYSDDTARGAAPDTVLESDWYAERTGATGDEARAAALAAAHAETPSITHLDTLGRAFLVQADNGSATAHDYYETRSELDIEGKVKSITDAVGTVTIRQRFDVLGRRYRVASPDAGTRLAIADVAGKPLRAWDSRGQTMRTGYDELQRPVRQYVRQRGAAAEQVVLRTVYGESLDAPRVLPDSPTPPSTPSPAQSLNLRGQAYLVFDSAGLASSDQVDFKGNPLRTSRRLFTDYTLTPDWSSLPEDPPIAVPDILAAASPLLDAESYQSASEYDALSRVTRQQTPDGSVTVPHYNEANLLDGVDVTVRGVTSRVLRDIDYNARGQRLRCVHGRPDADAPSFAVTYEYDPNTFRLTRLVATRQSGTLLQDLTYTFDPAGNIVAMRDASDPTPIFSGSVVSGDGLYEYDALYRLIRAEGREHPGAQPVDLDPPRGTAIPHPNDLHALQRYSEAYDYDPVGNIRSIVHTAGPGSSGGWTRNYRYAYELAGETPSNRLRFTSLPGAPGDLSLAYSYNEHGSMASMPHMPQIDWDYAERMRRASRGGGGDVFFTYDAAGQRVRKVYVHSGLVEERIYLGGFEVYRRWDGATLDLERETLHVMDDQRRIAMVETTGTASRWRFQLDNHLGSSTLELDHAADVISYEEFHPYGSTAFHTARGGAEVSAKRYRYTGKERDEETGLYYHGARYYAAWLARWTTVDPAGLVDGLNLYRYSQDNPVRFSDPGGTQTEEVVPVGTAADGGTLMSDGSVRYESSNDQTQNSAPDWNDAPAEVGTSQSGGIILSNGTERNWRDASYEVDGATIPAYEFPGRSGDTVLIYGGIHPNETAAISTLNETVRRLDAEGRQPEDTLIIVPDINANRFSDSGDAFDPSRLREIEDLDLNSNLPPPNQSLAEARGKDAIGRDVDPNLAALIELRESTDPTVIVQAHGYSDPAKSGVTTDPRTDTQQHTTADVGLAREVATTAKAAGAPVPYNRLGSGNERFRLKATGRAPGEVTGGQYFSTGNSAAPAANVLLIETSYHGMSTREQSLRDPQELSAFATALISTFAWRASLPPPNVSF